MKKRLIAYLIIMFMQCAFATPKEIILIRHADKLLQKNTGPCLSPKGQIRAILFGDYFLKTYGEPDFIIASNPGDGMGKHDSLRELQTVAPLANMLAAKHPDSGFPILHPYETPDFQKLATFVLTDSRFQNKRVLICWSHGRIPKLAKELGVKEALKKWPGNDFDSVFVLKYDSQGKLTTFNILNNQYPNNWNGSWNDVLTKLH